MSRSTEAVSAPSGSTWDSVRLCTPEKSTLTAWMRSAWNSTPANQPALGTVRRTRFGRPMRPCSRPDSIKCPEAIN